MTPGPLVSSFGSGPTCIQLGGRNLLVSLSVAKTVPVPSDRMKIVGLYEEGSVDKLCENSNDGSGLEERRVKSKALGY